MLICYISINCKLIFQFSNDDWELTHKNAHLPLSLPPPSPSHCMAKTKKTHRSWKGKVNVTFDLFMMKKKRKFILILAFIISAKEGHLKTHQHVRTDNFVRQCVVREWRFDIVYFKLWSSNTFSDTFTSQLGSGWHCTMLEMLWAETR